MDSPIERRFYDAWMCTIHQEYWELIPQYPIGKYRVDFAEVITQTAIELDGFASHSSTEDIARDCKRQREIEAMGWHVLRFGGKEIYKDAWSCANEAGNFLRALPFSAWHVRETPWDTIERDAPHLNEVFPSDYEDIPEPVEVQA